MPSLPCLLCGTEVEARRSSRKYCDVCLATKQRLQFRQSSKRYRSLNREKIRSAYRLWVIDHRERKRALGRISYERHREARLAMNRAYALVHPDETRAWAKIRDSRRRARKRQAVGTWTRVQFDGLCDVYDGRCAYCRRPASLTPDHVIPLARGGSNELANIVPACVCNRSKSVRSESDFRLALRRRTA